MIQQTLLLTQHDIARLIDMRTAIRVTRAAFIAMARGKAVMPPKIYLPLPRQSDFRAMPAFLQRPLACGVKWVNVHPHNPSHGLPSVMGIIIMNDPGTGIPLAIMDGLLVTKLRTAAAAAVAAKALARSNSRVVGLIGCGAQADAQLLALREVLPIASVRVWGHGAGEAKRFCQRTQRLLPDVKLVPCTEIRNTVQDADIIVTITPSHRPLIKRAWVRPGTHLNAIGADAPGKQELDPRILRDATVVVDHREQAIHGGELNVPVHRHQFDPRKIHATLGEILLGRKRARRKPHELTVFDSTGLAIHDVALGAQIVRQAHRRRVGQRVKFFDHNALR